AHTLMLGRQGATLDKNNTTTGVSNAIRSTTAGGQFDLTQTIRDDDGNEWTIVEVAPFAFYNNKAISGTIYIPAVTNIGDAAFGYATGLTGFTLGNKLERIGHAAFVSTFGNLSFTPSLPPSLKIVSTGAFAHHSKWDSNIPMKLSGEIELRGVETLQSAAFYMDVDITKVVIGPKLTSFGVQGSGIDSMDNTKGIFERCDKLHTVEWYGPAPTSGFVKNTFWTSTASANVTNYVYIDYFDGWTNAMTACGLGIGALVSGKDPAGIDPADYDLSSPAVYEINPNDNAHKGKIFLSLLPGHPAVEGSPVFNSAPTVTKENNEFVFRANMDEGEDCDLFAVFTDRAGNAVTNALDNATGVDGDPDTFYTCTPTGLTANKLYSFAVLGTKGSSAVLREGVGTFFNGEINITAPAAMSENGGSGVFTFTRGNASDTGVPGGAVTVAFTLSGTAAEFTNFREVVRTVTIPEGEASATVPVEAVIDLSTGDKTLSLVPDPNGLYIVGTTETATITDWVPPAVVDFDSTIEYKVAGYDANKSALANFPVLVRIPEGTVADNTQMAFFDASGAFLPYEIDTWDATGESLVWVLMPSLSQNATLTLASGNAGWTAPDLAPALWRAAGYVAVLHLGEDGPFFEGSTVQGIDGTGVLASGTDAGSDNSVSGAIGAARLVDEAAGSNQARIAVDDFEDYLDSLANMTISLWAKHSATRTPQNGERLFGNRNNTIDQATGLSAVLLADTTVATPVLDVRGNPTLQNAANLDQFIKVQPGTGVATSWSDTWTHMSFSFNANPNPTYAHVAGSRAAISNNRAGGSTQSPTFAALLANGNDFSFGNSYDSAGGSAIGFKGSLDEIRVKNGSVSDDWAFAEEATVSNAKFLVSGDDVALSADVAQITATVGTDAALLLQVQLLGSSASAAGSITVDWGDGTTTVTNLDITAAGLAVSLTHAYAAAGSYTVSATATVTATDNSDTVSARVGVLPAELALGSGDSFTRCALLHTKGYAGTTALANFPVLVRISESAIDGFDYDDCATGGEDISFSLPDGTVLPHE
ncbi:MAG: leucine-rich repeat protein, partial [Kiritimatiellae bacterium]|nr:leucine-rich repeat protein [Kiritimatiellia bacterium]